MRKRIVIGLTAVGVMAVVAIVMTWATAGKPGTVEWHKRQFWAAEDRMLGRSPGGWVKNVFEGLAGTGVASAIPLEVYADVKFHRQALLDLEYLEKRTIVVAHPLPRQIESRVAIAARRIIPEDRRRFVTFVPGANYQTDPITIICPREDMRLWEELIRKADGPN